MTALVATVTGGVGALRIDVALATSGAPLVLVGPNGAGKTSVLLMLLGVLRPATGRIVLGDTALFDSALGIDVPAEERRIGYVPQDYALFPHMTVAENLAFALDCRGALAAAARRERVTALLADLDALPLAARRPATLSGGERQRVALARALAGDPRALVLDEPLAALDIGARRQVRAFLAETLARLGLPAIVVTHDAADAIALGERVAVIEAGRVVQTGGFAALRAAPATPFVTELVASAPSS
jgi:molybdate transport system ATP-binding protein